MPNWKQADFASDTPQVSAEQFEINRLRAQMDRDGQIVGHLERNILPGLEKELAELEAKDPPPPPRVAADECTSVLNTSVMIEVLTDVGPAGEGVAAGTVITTLEGSALEALRARNPQRKIVRVSLETLQARRKAGHCVRA